MAVNEYVIETEVSYEDFLERYADQFAEWVEGVVYQMSPETGRHDKLIWLIRSLLETYADRFGGFDVRDAPFQTKLGPDLPGREPDVMVVAHTPRLHHTYLEGPPDIAVEVISPESEQRDRITKFAEYQAAGVKEYWLIDPLDQPNTAVFYQLNALGEFEAVPLTDGWYQSAVMEQLRFNVAWLLADPPPTNRALVEAIYAL